jgi:hypothetical protein
MDRMNYKEELETLCRAGFTREEILRLSRFRQTYHMYKWEEDQPQIDLSHLRFIRWLVEHGKLSEQLG